MILTQVGLVAESTARIENLVAAPPSNCKASYPDLDHVALVCSGCTSLKTSGSGLNQTVTCLR